MMLIKTTSVLNLRQQSYRRERSREAFRKTQGTKYTRPGRARTPVRREGNVASELTFKTINLKKASIKG